ALESQRAAVNGHRQLALGEQAHDPPEADTAAVLEQALACEVAARHGLAHAVRLGQPDVGMAFAVLHRGLGSFLVVQYEVDGDPRAVRPFWIGRVGAVADKVAARLVGHGLASAVSECESWKASPARTPRRPCCCRAT